ncbi:endo-1,4-beta-xylanase [Marinilongibacter aquaticus]|uniref:endo-1,4-beta-xylanase n=1 Tax=Marinilongibacter aquaticus TaxID=2975157 RepID=UPI0021BD21E6|nr:endo-1,4-beta-xylanase [Marinilongibacter aquaticus]UBM59968.1 endo-1,4-beta-xylanase [Marinilongibacter aquaticus]
MKKTSLFAVVFLTVYTLIAQPSQQYFDNWNDPYIQQRIEDGIRQNRMGAFTLAFEDKSGEPINGLTVEIKQIKHDFYFGANGFMVNGFKDPKENELFEKYFTQLFNFVTIPFYWPELELQPGKLRFDKNSEEIYRRPAPDVVLEFSKKYGLTPKGHTLVWDNPRWSIPDWLPANEEVIEQKISKRIEEIAERYGHSIQIWDVANEVTDRHPDVIMPKDFTYKAFKESERLFPYSNDFTLNFTTGIWKRSIKREYSADYLLIDNLKLRNAKMDAIGFQYHNFNEDEYWKILKGDVFSPKSLFETLDLYSDFNLPLHITEITVSALSDKGPEYQAIMTENLYKLWFSHPKVEAIIWWNLVDQTAAPGYTRPDGRVVRGEDKWMGGLLNRDFSKKPAFDVLDRLINKEWKTQVGLKMAADEDRAQFRGFYGEYELVIKKGDKTYKRTVDFGKKSAASQVLVLD